MPVRRRLMGRAVWALAFIAAPLAALHAQAPVAASAKPAKPAKAFRILTPGQMDPQHLLPPPPIDGSPAQLAELEELRQINTNRTTARLAQAQWDGAHEDVSAFFSVLGPGFNLDKLPKTRQLLAIVQNDQSAAATLAKKAFHRHRPWVFDPSLSVCEHSKSSDPLTSYPSGHATLAYSQAVILAHLVPSKAPALLARASDFAYSRLVCEVHFRSDIVAGQALGTAVGVALLDSPALKNAIDAARAELDAAGLENQAKSEAQ